MKKESKKVRLISEYDAWSINDEYSGVVIIPVKKKPFLIIKDFGAPCFLESSDGSVDYL